MQVKAEGLLARRGESYGSMLDMDATIDEEMARDGEEALRKRKMQEEEQARLLDASKKVRCCRGRSREGRHRGDVVETCQTSSSNPRHVWRMRESERSRRREDLTPALLVTMAAQSPLLGAATWKLVWAKITQRRVALCLVRSLSLVTMKATMAV